MVVESVMEIRKYFRMLQVGIHAWKGGRHPCSPLQGLGPWPCAGKSTVEPERSFYYVVAGSPPLEPNRRLCRAERVDLGFPAPLVSQAIGNLLHQKRTPPRVRIARPEPIFVSIGICPLL